MEQEITDRLFVREMQILWQGLDNEKRDIFSKLIKDYFDSGDRPFNLIEKMQEQIEEVE